MTFLIDFSAALEMTLVYVEYRTPDNECQRKKGKNSKLENQQGEIADLKKACSLRLDENVG